MKLVLLALALLSSVSVFAQQPAAPASPQQETKRPISPAARLAAAKTAYMKNGGGSDVPFNLIENAVEGWPRFILVDSPEQADVIIQVDAPFSLNSTSVSTSDGQNQTKADKKAQEQDVEIIKLTIIDARTHLPLWGATERPKGGFRAKTRDENLIAASQKLLERLHERLDPQPTDAAPEKK